MTTPPNFRLDKFDMASGNKFKPEDINMALSVHAMSSTVEKDLRAELDRVGLGHIKIATLRTWIRDSHRDQYEQICRELEAVFGRQMIEHWRGNIGIAQEVVTEAMRQGLEALKRGEIDAKDLTKTAKDAAVVAAVGTDKYELLSGRPTERVAMTTTDDLQRELASVGITIVMPGQADQKPAAIDVQAKPTAELTAGA